MKKKYLLIPVALLAGFLFISPAFAYGPDSWSWFSGGGAIAAYTFNGTYLPTSTMLYLQCAGTGTSLTDVNFFDGATGYENNQALTPLGGDWYSFLKGSNGAIRFARVNTTSTGGYNSAGADRCGGSTLTFQDFAPQIVEISLVTPAAGGTLYNDFPQWKLDAAASPGDLVDYAIQWDTADDLSSSGTPPSDLSFCGQSPGVIQAASTTFVTTSTLITLNKNVGITPAIQNTYTNPVNGNGYLTTIYVKTCINDLTANISQVTTTTLQMYYGGAPLNTGGTTTTLSFFYPTSSSYLYNPFTSYLVYANGIASSSVYTLTIQDQAGTSTPVLHNTQTQLGNAVLLYGGFQAYNDFYNYNFGDASSVPLSVTASLSGQNGLLATATGTFNMIPWKQVTATGTINPNGTSTLLQPIQGTTNGQGNGTVTTTSYLGPGGLPTNYLPQTAAASCPPPGSWTDIGGGLYYAACSALNFMFYPANSVTQSLQGSVTNMETVPPFVYFFQVNNAVQEAVNSASSTSNPLTFVVVDKMNGGTSTLDILPADLATNPYLSPSYQGAGENVVNLWFNLCLEGCILLIIIMFYRLVF